MEFFVLFSAVLISPISTLFFIKLTPRSNFGSKKIVPKELPKSCSAVYYAVQDGSNF